MYRYGIVKGAFTLGIISYMYMYKEMFYIKII